MNADGTAVRRLMTTVGSAVEPAWSPDGARIAFYHRDDIWLVNTDGSHATRLYAGSALTNADTPAWSPDGERIVFTAGAIAPFAAVVTINVNDGTQRKLTTPGPNAPAWSPSGDLIVFGQNYRGLQLTGRSMRDQVALIDNPGGVLALSPTWSPDGARIAFGGADVYVMYADGGGLTQLTHDGKAGAPSWYAPG